MERQVWALLVRYDGGPYKGWQPHPQLPTVGGVLAAALQRVGVRATPFGASRTDAGVHARAQVASFSSRADLDPERLQRQLNDELPSTVRVLAARRAPKSFHSHWSSIGKVYRYRISFAGEERAWRFPSPRFPYSSVDRARFEQALAAVVAAPDVSALCAGAKKAKVRRIDRAQVLEFDSRGLTAELAAAGFGKYLVRHLISGALGVGASALTPEDFDAMMAGRLKPPPKAAPEGLCLHRVLYPTPLDPFPDVDALAR